MRSFIYQISDKPINDMDWPYPEDIVGGDMALVDCGDSLYIANDRRKEAINSLIKNVLPEGMLLEYIEKEECVRYTGGIFTWSKAFAKEIATLVQSVQGDTNWAHASYLVRKKATDPLNTACHFIIEPNSCVAERSVAIMEFITNLSVGNKFYFGAIYEYHL